MDWQVGVKVLASRAEPLIFTLRQSMGYIIACSFIEGGCCRGGMMFGTQNSQRRHGSARVSHREIYPSTLKVKRTANESTHCHSGDKVYVV